MNERTMEYVRRAIFPTALSLMPSQLDSVAARAMLLAIGLQESGFDHRRQIAGPARGFWQFEPAGARAVLEHFASRPIIAPVLDVMRYENNALVCYAALEHNDALACCFARALLWTHPHPLPQAHETERAWKYYLDLWRPGRPRADHWSSNFAMAWDRVEKP